MRNISRLSSKNMSSISANNKRIAKNTLLLYFRMLLLMFISLYTSRVILNALGVTDYGIYNVVGGVVTMFSLLSSSLNAAISRFITYELGTGNTERLKKIFSSAITIQGGLALIIIFLAETIGLCFLNYKMVIPVERMIAAKWCFQFSVVTFAINLISVPYNAAIVAHERMSAFAYISLLEATGKLIIAWYIAYNPIDRLIFYAAMVAVLAWTIRMIYASYCRKHFEECTFLFVFDKMLLKQMFGFAGWNFIGASSAILRTQGINILLNLFFGPTLNAARAIGVKVNSTITGFVHNFMVALNPQITKSYASGDKEYMFKLIYQGARLSFYILLLLGLPLLLNTHYVLVAWLKLVPEHTVLFVQLTLIFTMSECISNPLKTAMLATGRIRNYQIVVGGLQMLNIPVAYVFLLLGAIPESVVIIAIVLSQCCLAARLIMLRSMIDLKIRYYIKHVYLNVILVSLLSVVLPFLFVTNTSEGFVNFCIATSISIACTIAAEMYIGCTKKERQLVYHQIYKGIEKIRRR